MKKLFLCVFMCLCACSSLTKYKEKYENVSYGVNSDGHVLVDYYEIKHDMITDEYVITFEKHWVIDNDNLSVIYQTQNPAYVINNVFYVFTNFYRLVVYQK